MNRAPRAECSDEFNKAASSQREEGLLREVDGKMKNIAEVVNDVKAAVSAIQEDPCKAGLL
jgi:hypothetical protein